LNSSILKSYTQSMTKLTRVAMITRTAIRFSWILVLLIIFGRAFIGIGGQVYRSLRPDPTPKPTVAFGKLPSLPFPAVEGLPQFEYKLDTVDSELPKFPDQGKVFFMPKSTITLYSLERSRITANLLGFNTDPFRVSQTVYRFSHPSLPSQLEINIATKIFSISYDLEGFLSPLENRPPAPEVAIPRAKAILASANVLADDISRGDATHELLRVEEKNLIPVVSLSEANLIKVNLFREPYDSLPSLTPFPNQANVWLILSGSGGRDQVLAGENLYFPVDKEKFATYSLKSSANAFEELKNNQAYIASIGQNLEGSVSIRKVYLAYYDAGFPTDFYQPVIVFEGDKNFMAYVPAVSREYYGE